MNSSLPTIRKPIYGWIPDLPDHRDKYYYQLTAVPEKLPSHIDLREHCSPVDNQGQLGSCTANALVGNLEYIKIQTLKKNIDFSRLFIYYNERVISHNTATDSGASLRDGIKTLHKQGVCPEPEWPYDITQFTVKPPAEAYQDALNYQITAYFRLLAPEEMKHTLMNGYPFVFGFSVYESFESVQVAKTGLIPMPGKDERLIGGHAVMAAGYDDDKKLMIIRNSWGAAWGDDGYCYMPYDYIFDSNLASDFWTIRDME